MFEYIIFFTFFYFILDYYNFFGIYGVPGSIQVNFKNIINYYINLFVIHEKNNIIVNYEKNYQTVYGFCCRQLFSLIIQNLKNNNKNLVIGVSPIHHTSFINIINNNINKENIHILKYDKYEQKIIIPDNKKNIKFDLIVITHLWGKYLDMKEINNNYKNTIIIEDVILGGIFKDEFNNNSDIIFHSCGMDKRPSSVFGGYVHIKKNNKQIINNLVTSLNNLDEPNTNEILKKLNDTLILYIIYNIRVVQNIFKIVLSIFNINLTNTIMTIRKKKPGFEHNNYMKKPTNYMLKVMKNIYNTQEYTEKLFIKKNKIFLSQFKKEDIKKYFPWNIDKNDSCLPYNPIYIDNDKQTDFIKYFEINNICILKNPTYKTFNNDNKSTQLFLDNIIYLPCLHNLNEEEIINLTKYLKIFFKE